MRFINLRRLAGGRRRTRRAKRAPRLQWSVAVRKELRQWSADPVANAGNYG